MAVATFKTLARNVSVSPTESSTATSLVPFESLSLAEVFPLEDLESSGLFLLLQDKQVFSLPFFSLRSTIFRRGKSVCVFCRVGVSDSTFEAFLAFDCGT